MQETRADSEFHLVVTGTRRDGRRRYDKASKAALARACLEPGVSLAGMALRHGVNANLLRKWVVGYQLSNDVTSTLLCASPMSAFVPVLLGDCNAETSAQGKRKHLRSAVAEAPSTTRVSMPPARLRAQLPNGVTLDFECAADDSVLLSTVIDMLGRCDVSPRR